MESPYFQCENLKLHSTLLIGTINWTRHHEKIFPRTRAIYTYSVAKHVITRVVTILGSGTRDIQGWQNLPRAIRTKSGSQNCLERVGMLRIAKAPYGDLTVCFTSLVSDLSTL